MTAARPFCAGFPVILPIAMLAILGGCAGESSRAGAVSVHDSAGIRIVASFAPVWEAGTGWRLSAGPKVRIGSAEGLAEEQLFRVNDAARFDDGRIAVANGGSHEVRIYTASGRHLQSIGGRGGGPGEFRFPRLIWILPGDTLLVMDRVHLSRFDRTGTFTGSIRVPRPVPILRAEDGTFLSTALAPGTRARERTLQRPDIVVIRALADGSRQDTLMQLTGDERIHVSWTDGILAYPAPFGARRSFALHADSIYTGDGSVFDIRLLDGSGIPRRILRRPDIRREIGPADIARYESDMLEGLPTEAVRQRTRDLLENWEYPERHPAWDVLHRDASGAVWVRHYLLDGDAPTTWSVFAPEGSWLGEVVLPGRFRIREIGADYILGIVSDELGVEYVELYGLEKG